MELDWRTLAQQSIVAYMIAMDSQYMPARVHYLLGAALDKVVNGKSKRLMIFMPPQHGKSRQVSETLPAFYHGHHPTHNIIHLTYSGPFAKRFGRANRNKLQDRRHLCVFGGGLAADSQSANQYNTVDGGQYIAGGIRGGVTGNPADLIIIDDPIKNRKEVQSRAIMENIRDLISGAIRSRMHKNTAIVVMHTRWAEDDPAGYMLEQWEADGWEVLSLPALVETAKQAKADPLGRGIGEALWPERFPADFLRLTKRAMLPRDWAALYQQAPIADVGMLFSREDFNWYDPDEVDFNNKRHWQFYGSHDGAVAEAEEGRKPDRTEMAVWAVDNEWNIYAVDWWQAQTDIHEWGETLLDMAQDWGVQRWVSENGVIRHASEAFLKRRKNDRKIMISFKWLSHVGDKQANVATFRAFAKTGKIYLPLGQQWAQDLVEQLCKFPAAAHDDKVDACGFIGRFVHHMINGDTDKNEKKTEYGTMDWLLNFANNEIDKERKKQRRRR